MIVELKKVERLKKVIEINLVLVTTSYYFLIADLGQQFLITSSEAEDCGVIIEEWNEQEINKAIHLMGMFDNYYRENENQISEDTFKEISKLFYDTFLNA